MYGEVPEKSNTKTGAGFAHSNFQHRESYNVGISSRSYPIYFLDSFID